MELRREACLIDGQWVAGDSWINVDDPATGAIIGRVPSLGVVETERAIEAAARAMRPWAALAARDRATLIHKLATLIVQHGDALASIITREQGKPLTEARGEVEYAASFLTWFAEEGRRVYGDVIPGNAPDKRLVVLKQPVGVVAAITPWNFPLAMITRKLAPALAAGCGVVVKPAEQTPFSAIALGILAEAAGLPPGLLNIITGDAATIGGALTASPTVRKISFTGSTATGMKIYTQSAQTIKKLSLELGGNAPFIVFDDADLDAAVEGALQSKFRNAGQTCVCANRFYVQTGIHDLFVERLKKAVATLRLGPGTEETSDLGPLIDNRAVAKVQSHINDVIAKGGQIVVGGHAVEAGSRFFPPTIVTGVTGDMAVASEETFGPLAPISRFETDKEVIALANASEFGLAAYFYSRDISRIWRIAEALEAGMVGVNTGLLSTEAAPFGGIKASGLGREGSKYGIEDYLETKYMCITI